MPKKINKKSNNKQIIPWMVVVVLVLTCSLLIAALINKNENKTSIEQSRGVVSLGALEYRISDGKATKRHEPSISKLRTFLEDKSVNERCSVEQPAHEAVIAYTSDETQVFLKYGCNAADSPMYIVKINDEWQSLSPTNHFDSFGIAGCDYLTQNSISSEIAPVCVNNIGTGEPAYIVRQ